MKGIGKKNELDNGYYSSEKEKKFLEEEYKIEKETIAMIDVNEIISNFLYIGDFWTCKIERALKKRRIQVVINCTNERHKEENKFKGIEYHQFRMNDVEDQDILQFVDDFCKIIQECISFVPPKRVYVHCHQGVSRSSSMVIAYIIITKKCSYEEAYDFVSEKRSCITPNDGFVKQLKKLVL